MSFCSTCGRPRSGTTRFCPTCGTRFPDAPTGGAPAPETVAAEGMASGGVPADTVAAEGMAADTVAAGTAAAEPTLWDQPVADPAKTALSFPSRRPDDTPPDADPWLASNTQSLLLPPSPAGARWEPPPPAPPVASPPGPRPGGPPGAWPGGPPGGWPGGPQGGPPQAQRGRGRKTALIAVGTVVVVLAAGGGAFALVSSVKRHPSAGPTSHPTVAVSPSATTAPATPSATPTASPTPTPTPSPSPTSTGTVSVAPGVSANPAAPQVTAYLNSYFHAINTHNYQEYTSLLDAQMQANNTPSSFASGYGTTTDSAETLTAISDTGGGGVAATVSFTSHQSAAESIDDSTCTDWTITLYLEPQGSGYVDTPPPSSYRSTYTAC